MHRRALLDLLDAYRAAFPWETDVVDRIRELVQNHVDCFERSCRPGHITGAAWILSADRSRCLLTHHRKLGRWLQLGGHSDGQWDVHEVALREAREESGMTAFDFVPIAGALLPFDLDVHDIPARYDADGRMIEDAHEHHDIRFLLIAHAGQLVQASDESHDVAWFTPEEIRRLTTEESVLRMLDKAEGRLE
jgi:8-oxo-dGTP pyrophosphatase MutT (NUDIX family)